MGLADRLRDFARSQLPTHDDGIDWEKEARKRAEQEKLDWQKTYQDGEAVKRKELQILLDALGAKHHLKELRAYWGIGEVDWDPTFDTKTGSADQTIRMAIWDVEEKYATVHVFEEGIVAYTRQGKEAVRNPTGQTLAIQVQKAPSVFMIGRLVSDNHGPRFARETLPIPFTPDKPKEASNLLEDALFDHVTNLPYPGKALVEGWGKALPYISLTQAPKLLYDVIRNNAALRRRV